MDQQVRAHRDAALAKLRSGKAASSAEDMQQILSEVFADGRPPMFADVPADAFAALLPRLRLVAVLPDERVIREGDIDDVMYLLCLGRCKVTKTNEAGSEMVLAQLDDGSVFGEMALLAQAPRSASVTALDESLLMQISRDAMAQVTERFPAVAAALLRFGRQRLLANLMATSPLFRPLAAEQRRALIERFKSREVPAGEVLISEGRAGDGLYMVLTGRVEVAKGSGPLKRVLAHLNEGEVFGEMALLEAQPATATITSLSKSIVLKLPRQAFDDTVAAHPELLKRVREISLERQKTTDAILRGQLAFSDEGLVVL